MPVHPEAVEMQAIILAGVLGPDRGSLAPDDQVIEGWVDNPLADGAAQTDFGGYAAPTHSSDNWTVDMDAGEVATTGPVSLGTATTAGSDAIRYWSLRRSADPEPWFSAPLERPARPVVGQAVNIRPSIRFNTNP